MRRTLIRSASVLGLACAALSACSKDSRPSVSAAEQRRIDERRAEERRGRRSQGRGPTRGERKAQERKAEHPCRGTSRR